MLKRAITFTDFNGDEVTEIHYFNLMKTELLNMEVGAEGGSLHEMLKRIVAAEDRQALVAEFQRLIVSAHGERSEDGKKFMKSDAIRDEFKSSPAFDQLFFELISNANKASEFVLGIMPREMAVELQAANPQDKPLGPPPAPVAPPVPPTQ